MLALLLVAVWLAWQFAWLFASDYMHQDAPLQQSALRSVRQAFADSPPSLLGDIRRLGDLRPAFFVLAGLLATFPLLGFVPPLRRQGPRAGSHRPDSAVSPC